MTTGVLLMAYGSPRNLDEVEGYYTDIRGGRTPSPEALEQLKERYARIGGGSPLTEITTRQAAALEELLNQTSDSKFKTYVGMKHWHPFIREAVDRISSDSVGELIGIALAPHYSRMSIGGYEDRVLKARAEVGATIDFRMIDHWYAEPSFVEFSSDNLHSAAEGWKGVDSETRVFFTAHSLPARILEEGDPYLDQLTESSKMIAESAGFSNWEFAFQSASSTGEPWLGPDVLDQLEAFAGLGGRRAIIAPVGFVADHLEILYDVDVECANKCAEVGLEFRRTASPNDDPRFIRALADVVLRRA